MYRTTANTNQCLVPTSKYLTVGFMQPPTGIIAEKYKSWILTVGCVQPPTQVVAEEYKKLCADSLNDYSSKCGWGSGKELGARSRRGWGRRISCSEQFLATAKPHFKMRGRETRTKTLGKRKLICKRGEGVICLELNGCPDSAKCSDKGQLKWIRIWKEKKRKTKRKKECIYQNLARGL